MYISINWIKDFVDLEGIDVIKLINKFTMSTAEVEGITVMGENTRDVVVGRIEEIEDIENSDKLHRVLVDIGNEKIQSVCGASNIKLGAKIAFAKSGSIVNGVSIKQSIVGGVESNGMCLSEKELGISENHSGIIILDDDTKVGVDIKEVIPIDDVIYEVDNKSLTNRPDLWGHYGIAREIAAITGRKLKPLDMVDLSVYNNLPKLNINIEAKDDCYRYSAITIDNVTKQVSSYWIKTRLTYCGLRPINLLADMTNYIMLELGQPMHAFDKSFIQSINVKKLDKETKFTTLDNVERTLNKGTLMICNNDVPVAIAGVMGGKNTQITDNTNSLFLESANFNGIPIRKTASYLSLRTDASSRYEKMIDPELTKIAVARFIYILKNEDKNINISSAFTDMYVKHYPKITIEITMSYINRIIGIEFSIEQVVNILEALDYNVKTDGIDKITIDVPSFRATKDVTMKADIIEEIARIYGYDNITPKTNLWKVEPVTQDKSRALEYNIKRTLAEKYGLSEIHSYVWYDTKLNKELGIEVGDNLKIVNGLNKFDSTLREVMAPTILYAMYKNIKNYSSIGIFEIGKTFKYKVKGENCDENKVLCIGMSSIKKNDEELLFEVKKMIDTICKINKNVRVQYDSKTEFDYNYLHPINSFDIKINDQIVGYISVISPKIKDKINPKSSIVIAEIYVDNLSNIDKNNIIYNEISKYQTVDFDLSIIVDKNCRYSDIEKVILKSNIKYLTNYNLVDVYENEEKIKDKKTITIRFTLGSYDKTLTKEEIDSDRTKLINDLHENNMLIIGE